MSTTPATPGPYSGTSIPATTPAARPPGLAEAFTDAQLQAAIDAAFPHATDKLLYACIDADPLSTSWDCDAPARLAIARAFLATLPKPAEASAEPEQAKPADDGPPWIPHDGGPCPLKDEEVEEWEYRLRNDGVMKTKDLPIRLAIYWQHDNHPHDIIAYRVIKWKPGHGPQAASKADEPVQAEAKAQPWTPRPGDVVRLKSGGHGMTVVNADDLDAVMVSWSHDNAAQFAAYPAACLTPTQEGQP
jgi:uncharacterized protein YodC (DUF2158 family)